MKLEIGMYVRINENKYQMYTGIGKITNIIQKTIYVNAKNESTISFNRLYDIEQISNASHNIMDLIKKNDIILGKDGKMYQVWKIYKDYIFTNTRNKEETFVTLVDYQIDKILTKEQFENNCYKIGK